MEPGMELADIPDILLLRSLTTPLSSFQVLRWLDDEESAADESSSRLVLLLLLVVVADCSCRCSSMPLLVIWSGKIEDDASANSSSSCWAALFHTILSFCKTNFSIIVLFLGSPSGCPILCHSSTMVVIDVRHLVAGGISFTHTPKILPKNYKNSLHSHSALLSRSFPENVWSTNDDDLK